MPMPELIRFVCVEHQMTDAQGVRHYEHTADMTWDAYQDYDGECTWVGLAIVNPAS